MAVLILWNSKRLHIKGMYFILLHCEGTVLADLYTCWRQKYGEEALESYWGWCGRLEEIHGTVRRPLMSFRHQARDAGVAATATLKAAPQNTLSFLWAWEKLVPAALGTPSPGVLVEHTCQFLLQPLLITSHVTVHLPLSFAGWMKIIPGFDYFSFDWA